MMIRISTAFLCGAIFALSGCGMLFWSDTIAYKGGHWKGENRFLEITLEHERKTPWNPLNQNVLSRNYRTRILAHEFAAGAVKKTRKWAAFKGWVPRHGLQLAANAGGSPGEITAVMMVGLGDGYGSGPRHVRITRLAALDLTVIGKAVELKTADQLLAALPSPDGKYLALLTTKATMQNRTGRAQVLMHGLVGGKPTLLNRVKLKWSGAPGLPNMTWALDSSRLFLQRQTDMLEIAPGATQARPAQRFPACMTATLTGTNISDAGRFFYRDRGKIRVRRESGWIARNKIPMITDFAKIGAGCP